MIDNRKIVLSMIGIAIVVIILVGVTYAFFNYSNTGTSNTIRTGSINFDAEQGTEVTLSNTPEAFYQFNANISKWNNNS